jgi:hypothetical protein
VDCSWAAVSGSPPSILDGHRVSLERRGSSDAWLKRREDGGERADEVADEVPVLVCCLVRGALLMYNPTVYKYNGSCYHVILVKVKIDSGTEELQWRAARFIRDDVLSKADNVRTECESD